MRIDWQALCGYWQGILRLQDWEVKCTVERYYDMPDNANGCCNYKLTNKTAWITILDATDNNPARMRPLDQEATLVHELLHLHFAPLEVTDDKNIMEEWAIESIARGFLKVHRAGDRFVINEAQEDDPETRTVVPGA